MPFCPFRRIKAFRQFMGQVSGGGRSTLKRRSNEALWKTHSHPTEMAISPGEDILYVACANSNAVTAIETATGKVLETIKTALYPQAPNGSTPNSLALSPTAMCCWRPTRTITTWP